MNSSNDLNQAAIDFLNELLGKGWPDDRGIAELVGISPRSAPEQSVSLAREAGLLLGVWSEPQHRFVYPEFQFDRFGTLRPEVAELLSILPDDGDRSGWRRAFWLYSPHALLHGSLPAEVFTKDPAWVLEVAQQEFYGDPLASW
ncbi:hypothetical protein VOI32_03635 [Paraburkholderia caribensis]|uniref:DUF2384 domain-containing protein n=1 Tax=Paraburkholderia caribensis TaxID=75105 RepID=A0A9Q6S7R4_9BURK|nr:hypothetical protein [Paraburkholderia caribensis]MCO4878232.1 hypothetical protein [Paraburkholderia caribensis]PTB28664.1 hypothetical protein C9I56_11725 [Paraburkholderia caribensis]QLB66038.1 hypothetical protein A9O66_27470 [Paraburkholderia caribensis]